MQIHPPQIGSLKLSSPVILAPMAGITSLPYRRIMKAFGAGLVFSEMVSANGLIRNGNKTQLLLTTNVEEFPLGIQLFGDDPTVLAQAAVLAKGEAPLLDINMGCPVKKVVRSGAGSALLQTPQRISQILESVRKVYSGPLTVKIRSGWDDNSSNYIDIGKIVEAAGVDAITLHPRSRNQGFSGEANWGHIAKLKSALNIPVFGSGDIFTPEDGLRMFQQTNCDAIMIGRGGYGNPWLISQILALLAGEPLTIPTASEKLQTALKHIQLHCEQFGEFKTMLEMRKHLCWYARGLNGASTYRTSIHKATTLNQLRQLTEEFFTQIETL